MGPTKRRNRKLKRLFYSAPLVPDVISETGKVYRGYGNDIHIDVVNRIPKLKAIVEDPRLSTETEQVIYQKYMGYSDPATGKHYSREQARQLLYPTKTGTRFLDSLSVPIDGATDFSNSRGIVKRLKYRRSGILRSNRLKSRRGPTIMGLLGPMIMTAALDKLRERS